MTDYQEDLLILAVAVGFQSHEKNGSLFLSTLYKGETKLYPVDLSSDNAFFGKEKEIISIIDERLEHKFEDNSIQKRQKFLQDAIADEGNAFWDRAKSKKRK